MLSIKESYSITNARYALKIKEDLLNFLKKICIDSIMTLKEALEQKGLRLYDCHFYSQSIIYSTYLNRGTNLMLIKSEDEVEVCFIRHSYILEDTNGEEVSTYDKFEMRFRKEDEQFECRMVKEVPKKC